MLVYKVYFPHPSLKQNPEENRQNKMASVDKERERD